MNISRTTRKNEPVKYNTVINKQVKRALKRKRKKMLDVKDGNSYKKLANRWDYD